MITVTPRDAAGDPQRDPAARHRGPRHQLRRAQDHSAERHARRDPVPRNQRLPGLLQEPGANRGQVTAAGLIAFCAANVASYKVLREVRFVTDWPMSATKIQKFRLREL